MTAIKSLVQSGKIADPFCLPEGTSTEQLAKAFKEFAEPWPYNTLAMEGALNISLHAKFRCKTS